MTSSAKDPVPSWFWGILIGGILLVVAGFAVMRISVWLGVGLMVVALVGSRVLLYRLAKRDGLPRRRAKPVDLPTPGLEA